MTPRRDPEPTPLARRGGVLTSSDVEGAGHSPREPGRAGAEPSAEARRVLDEALADHLEAVRACGDAHRIGDRMRAAEQLIALCDRLVTLHSALVAAARATPALAGYAALLSSLIRELGVAQANRDGVRIADLLEHEAMTIVARCRAALSP